MKDFEEIYKSWAYEKGGNREFKDLEYWEAGLGYDYVKALMNGVSPADICRVIESKSPSFHMVEGAKSRYKKFCDAGGFEEQLSTDAFAILGRRINEIGLMAAVNDNTVNSMAGEIINASGGNLVSPQVLIERNREIKELQKRLKESKKISDEKADGSKKRFWRFWC